MRQPPLPHPLVHNAAKFPHRNAIKYGSRFWNAGKFHPNLSKSGSRLQEFKSSEEKWRSARLEYSTPVLFLRALLDGGKDDHPKLCAREEYR